MKPLKTLVIEDDPTIREYLIETAELSGAVVIGSAGNFQDALPLLQKCNYDVMLVDLDLGGLHKLEGIDLIRCCRQLHTENKIEAQPKVLVISVFGDEKSVLTAVEAGADGYLLKDLDPPELQDALSRLIAGETPISAAIAGHLLRKLRSHSHQLPDLENLGKAQATLSQREVDILEGLAKGYSYKEVANIMDLSYHTVSDYVKSIYKKLSVHSKSEAIYEAVKFGLIRIS